MSLRSLIKAFDASTPRAYRIEDRVEVSTSRYVAHVRVSREPPSEWSTVVGDYVQNLRAALDYLIAVLVRANGQLPAGTNAFPIFDQAPPNKRKHAERERWERHLAGVHPGVLGLIEVCQPFNELDGPGAHPLHTLRTLSNEDKHRALIPAFVTIYGNPHHVLRNVEVVELSDVRLHLQAARVPVARSLEDGDVVLDAPAEIIGPNPVAKFQGNLPLSIGFGRKPVGLKTLAQLHGAVDGILHRSRSFLGE